MRSTTGLGFGIAALVAAGVFAFWIFAGHQGGWFARAVQDQAARCFRGSMPCVRFAPQEETRILSYTSNQPPAGVCRARSDWQALDAPKPGHDLFAFCRAGATYLFHAGAIASLHTQAAQWTVCAKPDCAEEAKALQHP